MISRLKKLWKSLGPGLITGASDDDPSGIVTYTVAGSRLGPAAAWTMLYILPLMVTIQEMSARIGISSSCGLAGNLKRYYSKSTLLFMAVLIVAANIFNIGADVFAMAAAIDMFLPGNEIPNSTVLVSWLVVFLILTLIIILPYRTIVAIFKWLAFSLFAYVLAGLIAINNWPALIWHTIIPTVHLSKEGLLILIAVFGTTISPYMALWQASEEAEEKKLQNPVKGSKYMCEYRIVTKNELGRTTQDTRIGMFFSNFIGFFIIALTGSVLFGGGFTQVQSIREAAEALRPIAGDYAYILFSLGVISAGLLAFPILAGSSAYVLSEVFNWGGSLDKPFSKAKEFYLVIVVSTFLGLIIPYTGITAVQALLWTSIIHGIVAPFLIGMLIHMANNPAIVGPNVNSKRANILSYLALSLMTIAVLVFFALEFPIPSIQASILNTFNL